ncbi:MAG: response regulator [Haloarculaceae archaeon]
MAQSSHVVLVVDDEVAVADTYALRLETDYETRVAYGGEEALEAIDEDVDAVLLDRRMPELSGDEVLERLRDRGYGGVVVMTTAVDPDLNILEMDFDDYLCKPVDRETIVETLEQHLGPTDGTDDRLDEFFQIVSKLAVLREEKTRAELEANEEFQRLQERADQLAADLRSRVDGFDDLVETHQSISRGSS